MQTLYELLGALPDDDADRLRAAFSSAAKASHPDNNPDDPDTPQKFRRVVRAYAILRDERQCYRDAERLARERLSQLQASASCEVERVPQKRPVR